MFKIGDIVIDDDKLSWYYGREVVIKEVTKFSHCIVYTVIYRDSISYALHNDKIKIID